MRATMGTCNCTLRPWVHLRRCSTPSVNPGAPRNGPGSNPKLWRREQVPGKQIYSITFWFEAYTRHGGARWVWEVMAQLTSVIHLPSKSHTDAGSTDPSLFSKSVDHHAVLLKVLDHVVPRTA